MTVRSGSAGERPRNSEGLWYARAPEDVTAAFGVDPAVGLSAAWSVESPTAHDPNTLPRQQRAPAWRRFLDQSCVQLSMPPGGRWSGASSMARS
ncbi:cation-transporting P-type ATPase [Streptomyces sp. NPDC002463]|uniref:cation-transporting P-type ATPase n=1 Tax=Streptomyces sp. NPDC002463 TaxID=3364645 RepID=UPI0036C875BB